jgi:hypothetical protein
MDDEARQAMASMKMPRRPINFVSAKSGEILKLGQITCRVMEDGSRTDNRIGSAEFTLPPNTPGPPAHWHEMHDETFLVTKGMVRVRHYLSICHILFYQIRPLTCVAVPRSRRRHTRCLCRRLRYRTHPGAPHLLESYKRRIQVLQHVYPRVLHRLLQNPG